MNNFQDMLRMATSGIADATKHLQKHIVWDGKEFDTFAEMLNFVKQNKFLSANFLAHKDKICVFYSMEAENNGN